MKWGALTTHITLGFLILIGSLGVASANHSYVLTVHELMGGMEKAPSPAQKGFFLIDVRTPEEHISGFIPGTDTNIDFREIQFRHQEIGAKLNDHIVVYCQTGHRSNIAADTLMSLGYKNVYNVEGSMNAWEGAGYPIEHSR